ncbi:hypothetical protein [Microvirga terricola]|uniref:Uncharacterized protein n=1 Tax=Microvirga terricola TaxID=2719797 RepID=A0ABX0VBB6_9HYPH|nr:hypothetical protein [Microvirga terricola]NIX76356.1 hypothetical protein [Microvirga terricola]
MVAVGFAISSQSHHPSFRRQVGKVGERGLDDLMPPTCLGALQNGQRTCSGFEDFRAAFVHGLGLLRVLPRHFNAGFAAHRCY